ncbi:sterol desaturase family protein [Rhodovulum sp. DZ06]|uniref:sterol desaturase family protein n=1 Tax=Rhodovulum sp. DZ06 TaxID=3425126 RepID=UPI003D343632
MEYEPFIRLGVFLSVFAVMAAWEWRRPARAQALGRARRWSTNWAVAILDSLVVRLLFPAAAVGAALDAAAQGWGLFHLLDAPFWLAVLLTILAMDFAIWFQHLVFHKVPVLWRLHKVHHADRDVDVSTAIRFHPVEIALSMLLKIGLVYALGAPAAAVVAFEVLLNACAMFNHSNIRLPEGVERALRKVIVTPDVHRIHHSVIRAEHDSNYGFNLSVWDRAFGTFTETPACGQEGMVIGLSEHQDARPGRLWWTLALPFRGRA